MIYIVLPCIPYYNRLLVKIPMSRCQRVRRGGLRSGGSRPIPSGGGFSGWGLPSVFTPRRSNSMSIISRMVSRSCIRSSENRCASSDFRRRSSDCIFLSVWFIAHLFFCCEIKDETMGGDYANRTKNYSNRTFCTCPNYSNRTFQACNSLILIRNP